VTAARKHARGAGIQKFNWAYDALLPGPLDPSCIEAGSPVARVATVTRSADKRLSSGLWECSAGKFRVTYWVDEVILILDGAVTVREDGGGDAYTLRPGDAAHFPIGLVTHWDVPRFVRKFFVVRAPGGNPLVARVRQRLAI